MFIAAMKHNPCRFPREGVSRGGGTKRANEGGAVAGDTDRGGVDSRAAGDDFAGAGGGELWATERGDGGDFEVCGRSGESQIQAGPRHSGTDLGHWEEAGGGESNSSQRFAARGGDGGGKHGICE